MTNLQVKTTKDDLHAAVAAALDIAGESVTVKDAAALKNAADVLAATAVFATGEARDEARWLIRAAAHATGAKTASIHDLYVARAKGDVREAFTVPAINVRGPTYGVAQAAFRAASRLDVGTIIFEIARSEIGYTEQRPAEYASSVLAAALKVGWTLPVFLQGDHYQFSPSKYPTDPDGEKQALADLIDESLVAGFRNIDIDASTLVDLGPSEVREQQRVNATLSAEMCAYIRDHEPHGVPVSVGGEIGEVGTHVTSLAELEAYQDLYAEELEKRGHTVGPAKISINTGTAHGGSVDAAGKLEKVEVRFDVIDALSKVSRERYGMAGVVQHGASTLPESEFGKFPAAGACEIHLATGFQNLLFDHAAFPADLKSRITTWITTDLAAERKDGQSVEQFVYKTRKKAFGKFKRELWSMPDAARDAIMADMEAKFAFLFEKLAVNGTRALAEKYAVADTAAPRRFKTVATRGSGLAADEGE